MIKVCNAIMGSGKSSAAITYMNEHKEEKYIFITPFLEETKRVRVNCPDLHFIEPSSKIPKYGFTKRNHTESLISEGRNIATTHSAFKMYDMNMLSKIKEKGYILVIDENVDVLEQMVANPNDLKLVIENGFMKEENGEYRITDKEYDGTALKSGLLGIAKSRPLVKVKSETNLLYYWSLPSELITSFKDVFILTYMFESQSIYYMLRMNHLSYKYIGVKKDECGVYRFTDEKDLSPEYVKSLKDKIHILENSKLNSIGENLYDLSVSWFSKNNSDVDRLRRNIYNCYNNLWKVSPSERMWSTYKIAQHRLKGKGYIKSFLVFNSKATNNFRKRTRLVYAVNIFMNVNEKLFYKKYGIKVNEDDYALSAMIQWIWRSAIREGKDIYVYIPSVRMRTLLINWIDSVSKGVCN